MATAANAEPGPWFLALFLAPAFVLGVAFELFLGHRHDYTGHYAAGYGASVAGTAICLRSLPTQNYGRRSQVSILPLCVLWILAGWVTEWTVFKIAKFDEVDFFNQSLGAVLAMACSLAYAKPIKPPNAYFDFGLITGLVFLGVGACYAVA